MGVIAMRPMLNAGYDVKLASGVITAGGTLGHPDPALGDDHRVCGGGRAVGGQAVCGGDVAGFLPRLLYLIYVIGWAIIRPKDRAAAAARPAARPDIAVGGAHRGDLLARMLPALSRGRARARARAGAPRRAKASRVDMGLLARDLLEALVPVWLARSAWRDLVVRDIYSQKTTT